MLELIHGGRYQKKLVSYMEDVSAFANTEQYFTSLMD